MRARIVVACAFALGACADVAWTPSGARGRVAGTVSQQGTAPLPEGAVLRVTLSKVVPEGAPEVLVDEQVVHPRTLPVSFGLEYDRRRVDPRDDFAVEARITVGRELHFASAPVPVITRGHSDAVEVIVDAVAAYPVPAPAVEGELGPQPEAATAAPAPPSPPSAPEPPAPRAAAPAARPETVLFAPGNPRAAVTGRVQGYAVREYEIEAKGRQTLGVRMDSRNDAAHFALREGDAVLFDSTRAPARGWSGPLPRSGVYTLRVFLGAEEADRGESAEYSLQLELH